MTVMNQLFTCPVCGRNISFPNSIVNHMVCNCGMVIYKDAGQQPVTKMFPVISGVSGLIGPGTEGEWKGRKFIISGRFRAWYEESVFNYWTADFGDERIYYLAEGYGLFSIYEEIHPGRKIRSEELGSFSLEHKLNLGEPGALQLLRKGNAHYIDVEGSFYKREGSRLFSYEGVAENGTLVQLFDFDVNQVQAFEMHPQSFESFGFRNLRNLANPAKAFLCKECARETMVGNYPYTQSWTCDGCGNYYSLGPAGQARPENNKSYETTTINIPLGTNLTLEDTEYTVVGFICKEDAQGHTGRWKEYTLFHPERGYAFLNESEGSWTFLREAQVTPPPDSFRKDSFIFNGSTFSLFSRYHYRIIYAVGQFPGNIFNDAHHVYAYDFTGSSGIWSGEKSKDEGITWFYGTDIKRSVLKKQVSAKLPIQRSMGFAASSSGNTSRNLPLLYKTTLALIILVIVLHFALGLGMREKVLLDQEFTLADTVSAQTFVTPAFQLKKWKSNLAFDIYAPVNNSWFEVNATLVNASTGDEYSIEQGVEYYYGYTDGENWTEGDKDESAYLNSIPSGNYFLRISGARDAGVTGYDRVSTFHVKVTNDVPMLRNLVLTILMLLAYPIIVTLIHNHQQQQRWNNNSYSKND